MRASREVATLPGWLEAVLVFALALLGWLAGKRTWRVGLFGGYDLRPDLGWTVEGVFLVAAFILLSDLVYSAFGLIIAPAKIFIAVSSGLLIGNPPALAGTPEAGAVNTIGRNLKHHG